MNKSLRDLDFDPLIVTSTHDLLEKFYIPALAQSISYDRGVGYFTSAWLRLAASGLVALASNGGKARLIASPKLQKEDCAAIAEGADARSNPILRASLERSLEELALDLAHDTLAALSWMIADELLEFRIALPTGELDGDFHDKFGIFRDMEGRAVAFHGSPNDSERAFRNYESISVYCSWHEPREAARVKGQQDRFDLIWSNGDINLRTYDLPDAIKKNLIEFTTRSERPYATPVRSTHPALNRWRHQREAVATFLKAKHGILEMATGTGKTRTALEIVNELLERQLTSTVIVAAFGTDLLDQWHQELLLRTRLNVYRAYERHHEAQAFLNAPEGAVLLTSRHSLADVLPRLRPIGFRKGILICDEVHGMGSPTLVSSLKGRVEPFTYRLGLSATPDREYDAIGNQFITDEIGPVIFRFGLKDAIQRGILCELEYIDITYEFSDEDLAAVHSALRRYHARANAGDAPPIESLYQELARVRKLSLNKLAPFRTFVRDHSEAVRRCLIFVETAEYGLHVQDILMEARVDFHTYYGDDDRDNLRKFARGQLECLITCHRISEGIDIQSVNNIVLFATARARLETVQRLGRCLRSDPTNPGKRATVIDFIRTDDIDEDDPTGELTADMERRDWLRELSQIRRDLN